MATFVLVLVFMLMLVAAMAVGVIFGRQPIKGSCGGMSALGMETQCDVCGGDEARCEKETRASYKQAGGKATDLAVDASR